jgi:hypothetical protein
MEGGRGMSALILKNTKTIETHKFYKILHQDLKALPRYTGNYEDFVVDVKAGGWTFKSTGFPHIYYEGFTSRMMTVRGTDVDQDSRELYISLEMVADFERAVLELNKKLGNNKDITMDDVIWREDET